MARFLRCLAPKRIQPESDRNEPWDCCINTLDQEISLPSASVEAMVLLTRGPDGPRLITCGPLDLQGNQNYCIQF